MKLSTKIGLGFGILIAIAIIIGSMAVWKMQDVKKDTTTLTKEYIPEVIAANNIERLSLATMYAMRGYALTGNKHYLNTGKENIAKVFEHIKIAEDLAEKSPHLSKLKTALKKVEAKTKEYEHLTNESIAKNEGMDKQRDTIDKLEALYRKNCTEFLNFQKDAIKKQIDSEFISADESAAIKERFQKIDLINNILDLNRLTHEAALKFRASQDSELIQSGLKNFEILAVKFKEVKQLIHQENNLKNMDQIITIANNYKDAMKGLLENWTTLQNILTKREYIADEAVKEAISLADMGMAETARVADRTQKLLSTASFVMIAGLVSGSVFGIFLAIIIAKSISRPINRIVRELSLIADQAASGSGQVASACQALAQGVSELAASVEETSSSLEEISSLSVQNAENANKSDTLIKTVKQVVDTANTSMNELSDSIKIISEAGEASFKIVKTIDDISFQTNLLALNATIEAARAGEAGAGFVVVAAEVRHLASGAAAAAKETSTLIQEIVKNVRQGSELVKRTGTAFSEVGINVGNINNFIADISKSSIEQSQGITQINKAVSDIERIIQGNAANTEESASAAQQMNAQSEMMKGFVGEIVAMIEGSDSILKTRKGELR